MTSAGPGVDDAGRGPDGTLLGLATLKACDAVRYATGPSAGPGAAFTGARYAAEAAAAAMLLAAQAAVEAGLPGVEAATARRRIAVLQAAVLRDIVGNPFRPVVAAPAWLTPDATGLARAAYDDRILASGELDPDRLAVLSDALEEAGCDDEAILDHLRGPGPHVRGCRVLDLILGKR